MKALTLGLFLLGFVTSTFAADKVAKARLEVRIRSLTAKFEALQQKPELRIPAENLRKAHGIILLDRTKAGFVFAFQGGGGVAMVKEPKSEKWGPAAFYSATEASLGLQIGGQQSFVVILLMDTNATRRLTESTFEFGGEARGTVGDYSTGEEGKFTNKGGSVRVYTERKGAYAGAAIKGGDISPDHEANQLYYGEFLSAKDILFDRKVKPTNNAEELAKKLLEHSKERKP
jgi:lipid-binding SYLF domain-containing protein